LGTTCSGVIAIAVAGRANIAALTAARASRMIFFIVTFS
jgi:hypothetical protein